MGFFKNRATIELNDTSDTGNVPTVSGASSDEAIDLPGMPADYVLTPEQVAGKKAITTDGALNALDTMRPGIDYVAGEYIFVAKDEAEAKLIAAAYGGEFESFSNGVGRAKLDKGSPYTLIQLIAASADMNNNLPPIEVNLIYSTSAGEPMKRGN